MGTAPTTFDEVAGHRFFSAQCFNRTWELIEKPNRAERDDEEMLLLAQVSLWHWMQRDDCTPRSLSVGYWLLSRVHALLNQAELAKRHGELSLEQAAGEEPFYAGYAHEALARAALIDGDHAALERHLKEARTCAAQVTDAEERGMLERDLEGLR